MPLSKFLKSCEEALMSIRLTTLLCCSLLALPAFSADAGIGRKPQEAAVLAPAAQSPQLAAFRKAIRAKYDLKEKAWAAGDGETIVTRFYSADAISAGEGDPDTTVGRAALRAQYLEIMKASATARIESVHSFVRGNAGWDWTNFYHVARPGREKDVPPSPLRILFLWERIHGEWFCKGEMFVAGRM